MVDPGTAKQLADAGGWAAFLVVCATLAVGYARQVYVPGWVYRIVLRQVDNLIEQLNRNTEAQEKLTRAFAAVKTEVVSARAEIVELKKQLAAERDRGSGSDAGR